MPESHPIVEPEMMPSRKPSRFTDMPFDPADVDISHKMLSIDSLVERLAAPPQAIQMDTTTYFQRNRELWDEVRQSRLIESMLIRFPLPAFYFDGEDHHCWLIVDGLQRLTTLDNFVVKNTLRLRGLEFLSQLEGKRYSDLDRDLQRTILETAVSAFVINPGSPKDVKFNIYKRINTGSLPLNTQKIRHALNQGPAATLL